MFSQFLHISLTKESFFTEPKVEELVKAIREAESEVSRWREACELEVEAGQHEVELRDQLVSFIHYSKLKNVPKPIKTNKSHSLQSDSGFKDRGGEAEISLDHIRGKTKTERRIG